MEKIENLPAVFRDRDHPLHPENRKREVPKFSFAELTEEVEKIADIATITESKENGPRIVIAFPQIHHLEEVPGEHETVEAIQKDLHTAIARLALGGASHTVALEGAVLGEEDDIQGVYKIYGIEDEKNHADAYRILSFQIFIIHYFGEEKTRNEMLRMLARGEKIGKYLTDEFLASRKTKNQVEENTPEFLEEMTAMVDRHFNSRTSFKPATFGALRRELGALGDRVGIIERNVHIADNLVKLFDKNAGQSIILQIGAGHFDSVSPHGIPTNNLQELFDERNISYLVVTPKTVQTYREMKRKERGQKSNES